MPSTADHTIVVGVDAHARDHQFGVKSRHLVDRCFDEAWCAVTVVDESGSVHQRSGRTVGVGR